MGGHEDRGGYKREDAQHGPPLSRQPVGGAYGIAGGYGSFDRGGGGAAGADAWSQASLEVFQEASR